jgi:hypothetical protein
MPFSFSRPGAVQIVKAAGSALRRRAQRPGSAGNSGVVEASVTPLTSGTTHI